MNRMRIFVIATITAAFTMTAYAQLEDRNANEILESNSDPSAENSAEHDSDAGIGASDNFVFINGLMIRIPDEKNVRIDSAVDFPEMVAYKDPTTGNIGVPPPGTAVKMFSSLRPSTDHEVTIIENPIPGGGIAMKNERMYFMRATASTEVESGTKTECLPEEQK